MNNKKWLICLLSITMLTIPVKSQELTNNEITHLSIQRLNDSYIDVYHNPPLLDSMPILIFCQGSGYDSNTEGFLGLIRQFEDKVVGLAIEKEGVRLGDKGDSLSVAYVNNNVIHNRLYDYLRVLQHLRENATWWNKEIYIIGGSEGGLLAGMLASYYPDVRALSIFSFGGGLTFGEAWPLAIGKQAKAEGHTEEEIANRIKNVTDSLELIKQEPTFFKSYSGEDNTYAWWNSIMDLRLENCLLDLNIPILLVQGTEDLMVPIISARTLDNSFQKAGKKNLLYKEYEGYNHSYIDKKGQSHLVEVITESIHWMLKN